MVETTPLKTSETQCKVKSRIAKAKIKMTMTPRKEKQATRTFIWFNPYAQLRIRIATSISGNAYMIHSIWNDTPLASMTFPHNIIAGTSRKHNTLNARCVNPSIQNTLVT